MSVGTEIRKYFPFFEQTKKNLNWSFLDNAASSQKPAVVLEAMDKIYRTHFANVHRGVYDLAEQATSDFEAVRSKVAVFINAAKPEEIVFTKNTTEALNLLSYSLGNKLKAGDEILISEMEHHANLVPWQQACLKSGATLKYLPVKNDFTLDKSHLTRLINSKTKIVSLTAMSNSLGTINDLSDIIDFAHKFKALVVVDGAQFVPHKRIDVQKVNCDFMAFSGHKMYGPTGIGVLYGRDDLLNNMEPFMTGGHMIAEVGYNSTTWSPSPVRFEAGTPPIAEVIGLGAAIDFINDISWAAIEDWEEELTEYGLQKLFSLSGINIFGPKDTQERGPVFSFTVEGVHAHDVASILNDEVVAVRAGHHCTQPLHKKFGLSATTRASCAIYNTKEDIDRLVDGIKKAQKILG